MDQRSMPPMTASVRRSADLLAQRSESTAPQTVGQNWVRNFVNRHDEIKSKYNRKYDYQRAKCEDPAIIQEWFWRVQQSEAVQMEVGHSSAPQPSQRAPPRCSLCNSLEHNARTCPRRQSSV
jgi:hypothetical protein